MARYLLIKNCCKEILKIIDKTRRTFIYFCFPPYNGGYPFDINHLNLFPGRSLLKPVIVRLQRVKMAPIFHKSSVSNNWVSE